MQWLFLSPADSHINCGCDLRETEDSRDWGHVSAQRIIQAQYKDPRIFPTRQYFISWNRLISSFLTLLQYHLQEAETPPWAQEQSLRGLRLKEVVTLPQVPAPCFKTGLCSCTMAEGTETSKSDSTLPSTSQDRQTNGKRQQEHRPSSNMTERNPMQG